jgi:hypothetical protein
MLFRGRTGSQNGELKGGGHQSLISSQMSVYSYKPTEGSCADAMEQSII